MYLFLFQLLLLVVISLLLASEFCLQRESTNMWYTVAMYLISHPTFVGGINLTMVISLEHLDKISREYLTQWESLSPSLGLTVVEEEDIRRTYKEYVDQKRAVLRRWKHNKGNGATYGAFIAAAEGISNMELADGVRDLMKELQGMYTCI